MFSQKLNECSVMEKTQLQRALLRCGQVFGGIGRSNLLPAVIDDVFEKFRMEL